MIDSEDGVFSARPSDGSATARPRAVAARAKGTRIVLNLPEMCGCCECSILLLKVIQKVQLNPLD
jgi:hypothetical protein